MCVGPWFVLWFFLGVLSSFIFREDRYGIIDRYDLIKITVVIYRL